MRDPLNAIETDRLGKRFRPVRSYWDLARYRWQAPSDPAVAEVDLHVREGELFGLLGENGAGKTTLIRMLTTTLLPTTGTARVGGYDIVREPLAVRRIIGLVTGDERSFYWRLTGRQNLAYFAALYHVPRAETATRIERLLDTLEIRDYGDRRFDSYSTGIRQRFAIARGLLTEPRILFLDEPTRALDPIAADEVRSYIAGHIVDELGCTVLLATHTLTEAEAICDRIAIIRGGRLVETGTMDELRARVGLATAVEVTIRGGPQEIRSVVCGIEGIDDVSVVAEGQVRRIRLWLRSPGMTGLLRVILDAGAEIEECSTRQPTLDDIYRAAHA